MVYAAIIIILLIIIKNWVDYDPNQKKAIKNGRLVALQTFTAHGRIIKKGSMGAKVDVSATFNLYDNSWADAKSKIMGESEISGDTLITNSLIKNWIVKNARVENCTCDNPWYYRGGFWGGEHIGESYTKSNL